VRGFKTLWFLDLSGSSTGTGVHAAVLLIAAAIWDGEQMAASRAELPEACLRWSCGVFGPAPLKPEDFFS
jgi:hypothetical protein